MKSEFDKLFCFINHIYAVNNLVSLNQDRTVPSFSSINQSALEANSKLEPSDLDPMAPSCEPHESSIAQTIGIQIPKKNTFLSLTANMPSDSSFSRFCSSLKFNPSSSLPIILLHNIKNIIKSKQNLNQDSSFC